MSKTNKPYTILFFRIAPGDRETRAQQGEEYATVIIKTQDSLFEVEDSNRATLSEINEKLVKLDPDIIHFSGHGSTLALLIENFANTEKEQAETTYITPDELSQILGYILNSTKPRLLYFNACITSEFAKTIEERMSSNASCVIGMTNPLNQALALRFTEDLYEILIKGGPVHRVLDAFKASVDTAKIYLQENDEGGFDPQPKAYGNQELKFNTNIINNLNRLAAGADGLGKLSLSVPDLPSGFLKRPNRIKQLKEIFLSELDQNKILGLHGIGGTGKTFLAIELARDEEVRRNFPDGIIWITLGRQEPPITQKQGDVYNVFTGRQPEPEFVNVDRGKEQLKEFFDEEACLLIIDDVWELEHAKAFDVLGPKSWLLITTQNLKIIEDLEGIDLELPLLNDQEAWQLLAQASGQTTETLSKVAKEVAKECGNLPLALAMAGAMAQDGNRWEDLLAALQQVNLEEIEKNFPDYPYPNLLQIFEISVDALEEPVRELYLDFAVFPEDASVPISLLKMLWQDQGISSLTLDKYLFTLDDRSLLQRDERDYFTLHDLQLAYIRKRVNDLPGLHHKLLDAYRQDCPEGWHTGAPDGYFHTFLMYHFKAADRTDELKALLLDYRWLLAKLHHSGVQSLISDYDYLPEDPTLRLVKEAIFSSIEALASHPRQLPRELISRLQELAREHPELEPFLRQAHESTAFP